MRYHLLVPTIANRFTKDEVRIVSAPVDSLFNAVLRVLVLFTVQSFFAVLLYSIDSDKAKPKTVLLFAGAMTALQLIPVYLLIHFVPLDASGNPLIHTCLYTLPPPHMILCYYFYTHITHSKTRSKSFALVLYYALLLEAVVAAILQCVFTCRMVPLVDDRYALLVNTLVLLSMIPLSLVSYIGLKKMIEDLRVYASEYNATIESRRENQWASVGTITLCACVAFALCFFGLYELTTRDGADYLWISLTLLLFTIAVFGFIYLRLKVSFRDSIIESKNVYIASLLKNMDDFSGIRHDIGNILHVYGGYIHMSDIPELQNYHQEVVKTIMLPNKNMVELNKAKDNPVIFGLLSAKLHLAEQQHVTFTYTLIDDCNTTALQTLVFSRMLGILLDNAIEAAAISEKKIVHMETERVYDYISITLFNSTLSDVDVSKITAKGYSSKPGHSGHGLWEISKMITHSEGCSIHFYYADNRFTACMKVELRNENKAS